MAFKNIYSDEMIPLSLTWLDPGSKANAAILAVPELASFIGRITDAHKAVKDAEQPAESPRVAAIMAEEARLDLRHDAIIRGSWGTLTSLAELIGGDAGASFITLRDTIIPHGLQSQMKTYRAQAGQAAQLADRMTPELRAKTDAILIGQGPDQKTLTMYIDEWIAIGKQLLALEDEKGQLEADPSAGSEMVKARNLWIRVVNAMVANADLVDLDTEAEALIFGPLRDTERKADERVRQAAAKAKAAKAEAEAEKTKTPAPGTEANTPPTPATGTEPGKTTSTTLPGTKVG
jgi:hypothetical protein